MKKKTNNWLGLLVILPFSLACIGCFVYYTIRFCHVICINKETVLWVLFGLFILITLVIGILNSIKLGKLQKENIQLKETIVELMEKSDSHYYSTLEHIQNSREISLDVLNELREKP